jgi:hypothetical protein
MLEKSGSTPDIEKQINRIKRQRDGFVKLEYF